MTKPPDDIDDVLAELRRSHRELGPPAFLGTRLHAAASATRPRARWRQWRWALAAAVLVAAIAIGLWRVPRNDPAAVILATDFIQLPGSETLPAAGETSILRVEMAKRDLRQYGFDVPPPVEAEMVHADFVVGGDGLARAVRLVR